MYSFRRTNVKKQNIKFSSRLYAILALFLPILMQYKFPILNFSVSTILICFVGIIILPLIAISFSYKDVKQIIPLSIFFLFAAFKSPSANAVLFVFIVVHLFFISLGGVELSFIRKGVELISSIASILVIFQTVFYYLTGIHVPLVISDLCIDSARSTYNSLISTGISGDIYRPSAFFLEPAHFSEYCIFGFVSSLFSKKKNFFKIFLIAIGIVCTTSGIGIALVVLSTFAYLLLHFLGTKNYLGLIKYLLALLFIFLIAYQFPFVKNAVDRVFVGEKNGGMNAFQGRLFWWDVYFGSRKITDFIWGFGGQQLPDNYFTAFMVYIYAYGIVGFLLYSIGLLVLFFKNNYFSKLLIIIIFGLTLFANITNAYYLIFSMAIIITLGRGKEDFSIVTIPNANDCILLNE